MGSRFPSGTPGVEDDDRALTPKGEGRVHEVAVGLKRLNVAPARIVTSPLPRAKRTAEIVAEVLGMKERLEVEDGLRAGASATSIREWIMAQPAGGLMIVGHNPTLTDLVGLLIGVGEGAAAFELKKAGVAAFEKVPDGAYELEWLASPKLLRKIAG